MKVFTLMLLFLFSLTSFGKEKESIGHLYVGFGELYGVGTIRVGRNSWEFGKLNSRSIGFAKQLYKGNTYAAFGGVITQNTTPGFYGALGLDISVLSWLTLRGELNGSTSIDNYSYGELLIGATLSF